MNCFNWGMALRALVTIGILMWLALRLNWGVLENQFTKMEWTWFAAAGAIFGLVVICVSFRWWMLLKVQGIDLPFNPILAMTLIGLFFNTFLPGSVGGDVIKIFYILKYEPNRKPRAVLSILMDRFVGILILLTLAVATLPFQIKYFAHHSELKSIMISLCGLWVAVVIGIIGMLIIPIRRVPQKLKNVWERIPKHEIAESLIEGFKQHKKSWKFTLASLSWGVMGHFLGFGAGYCLARSLHLEASYFQIMIILAIVYILMSLPISISGHGVREFGAILMFSVYGLITIDPFTHLGQEPAIAFSLLLFGVNLLWGLVGGLVYLVYQHRYRANDVVLTQVID